jgi:hypothetical protein
LGLTDLPGVCSFARVEQAYRLVLEAQARQVTFVRTLSRARDKL